MEPAAKVTVFIAVRDRARYIGPAIESVLAQSFDDFELLVVDDGSTDDSVAVVRRFADRRIRLFCNDGNQGIPYTRNKGLQLARGEYLAVLDSDDVARPRRLSRQVAFLDSRPDVAVVGGWATEMDAAGRSLHRLKVLPLVPNELQALLLFRTCHHHASVMGRTSVLRGAGYSSDYPVAEDYDLFARLSLHGHANLPQVLLCRRVHAGRITRERADQVLSANMRIVARQLERLGMAAGTADVERHVTLVRLGKLGITPDRVFLEWAADWLERLQRANRAAGLLPQRALANMLGQIWLVACWHGVRALGPEPAWRLFRSSPLRSGLKATVRDNLSFAARWR